MVAIANFTLKVKDSGPPLVATLKQAVGGTVDLTPAASAELRMKLKGNPAAPVIKIPCELLSPRSQGEIRVKWSEANTAIEGEYLAEVKVIWTNGEKTSFPNNIYDEVAILTSLE